jgi:hypothetical protein
MMPVPLADAVCHSLELLKPAVMVFSTPDDHAASLMIGAYFLSLID